MYVGDYLSPGDCLYLSRRVEDDVQINLGKIIMPRMAWRSILHMARIITYATGADLENYYKSNAIRLAQFRRQYSYDITNPDYGTAWYPDMQGFRPEYIKGMNLFSNMTRRLNEITEYASYNIIWAGYENPLSVLVGVNRFFKKSGLTPMPLTHPNGNHILYAQDIYNLLWSLLNEQSWVCKTDPSEDFGFTAGGSKHGMVVVFDPVLSRSYWFNDFNDLYAVLKSMNPNSESFTEYAQTRFLGNHRYSYNTMLRPRQQDINNRLINLSKSDRIVHPVHRASYPERRMSLS